MASIHARDDPNRAEVNIVYNSPMSGNLFERYITGSREICSNCYSRCYETETYDQSKLRQSLQGVLTEDVEKTKIAGIEHQQTYSASDSRSCHCRACGSDRRFVMDRPVSLAKAFEYADNLSERINEVDGLEVNAKALKGELRQLKKDDTNQRQDDWIFREAIDRTVAVNH